MVSIPAMRMHAQGHDLNPSMGLTIHLIARLLNQVVQVFDLAKLNGLGYGRL